MRVARTTTRRGSAGGAPRRRRSVAVAADSADAHPAGEAAQLVGGQNAPFLEMEGNGSRRSGEDRRGRVDDDGGVVHSVQHFADTVGDHR